MAAIPTVIVYLIYILLPRKSNISKKRRAEFASGFVTVLVSVLVAMSLISTSEEYCDPYFSGCLALIIYLGVCAIFVIFGVALIRLSKLKLKEVFS
jgi:Na+/proline symporter